MVRYVFGGIWFRVECCKLPAATSDAAYALAVWGGGEELYVFGGVTGEELGVSLEEWIGMSPGRRVAVREDGWDGALLNG